MSKITPASGDSGVSFPLPLKGEELTENILVFRPQLLRKWPVILERALDGDPGDPSLCPGPARKKLALQILGDSPFTLSTCIIRR